MSCDPGGNLVLQRSKLWQRTTWGLCSVRKGITRWRGWVRLIVQVVFTQHRTKQTDLCNDYWDSPICDTSLGLFSSSQSLETIAECCHTSRLTPVAMVGRAVHLLNDTLSLAPPITPIGKCIFIWLRNLDPKWHERGLSLIEDETRLPFPLLACSWSYL
jgi:hypothetical protein